MVGASKILTVSYGTFSCTLEGFDDPFNTMKAIAEYFRDLAAEDRYFGAEPPTPDAAMLHRIAEREVQRRVEAKVQENGVILRAHEDDAPVARAAEIAPAAVAVADAPAEVALSAAYDDAAYDAVVETVSDPVIEAVAEPFVEDPAFFAGEETAFAAPEAAPQPSLSDMPEGVAARLAKIRAAVALTEAAPAVSEYVEDQHAEESFAAFETLEDTVMPSVPDVSFSTEDDAEELAELAALDGLDAARITNFPSAAEIEAEEAAVEEVFRDTEVAADSAEYEELVEDTAFDAAPVVEAGVAEDAVAEEPATTDDDDMLASLSEALAEADAPAAVDADTIVFNDEDDVVLSVLEDAETPVEEADAADAESATAEDSISDDADEDDLAPLADEPVGEFQEAPAAVAADTVAEADDSDAEPVAASVAEEPVAEVAEAAVAEPVVMAAADANDKLQRARARIIRVRRAPEIAIEKPAEPAAVALSDEAEADLARELAALDDVAETVAEEKPAPTQEADDDLRRQLSALGADEPVAPATTALDPAVQDESLRRLMDQTQTEMAEPATRSRLSSIAHLKAAVAATIAERFGTKPKPVEEVEATRTEPYRNDLARAVRPVRPVASGTPTDRPTPLVLVSEQRIDRPVAPAAGSPVTPVRPRRVSAQAVAVQETYDEDFDAEEDDTDNIFGDSKGFAEFADRIGATDLSELLEAAAAYGSAVEGREHFTRPQLLRQISAVTGADVSREDELRGFGALLRDGRIVKVKRGQFALTEQSSYLDAARQISG
jgi:hypothetical protein